MYSTHLEILADALKSALDRLERRSYSKFKSDEDIEGLDTKRLVEKYNWHVDNVEGRKSALLQGIKSLLEHIDRVHPLDKKTNDLNSLLSHIIGCHRDGVI